MHYFVGEPLDDGSYQVWRVRLEPLTEGQEIDDDGVVVTPDGRPFCWRWVPIGDPHINKLAAKSAAYKLWYQ